MNVSATRYETVVRADAIVGNVGKFSLMRLIGREPFIILLGMLLTGIHRFSENLTARKLT
jgi:hypothetical protein